MSCRYPCSGPNFAFRLLDMVTLVVGCGPFSGSQNLFIESLSALRERKEREIHNTEKERDGEGDRKRNLRRQLRREGGGKTGQEQDVKECVVSANGKFCFMKFLVTCIHYTFWIKCKYFSYCEPLSKIFLKKLKCKVLRD